MRILKPKFFLLLFAALSIGLQQQHGVIINFYYMVRSSLMGTKNCRKWTICLSVAGFFAQILCSCWYIFYMLTVEKHV